MSGFILEQIINNSLNIDTLKDFEFLNFPDKERSNILDELHAALTILKFKGGYNTVKIDKAVLLVEEEINRFSSEKINDIKYELDIYEIFQKSHRSEYSDDDKRYLIDLHKKLSVWIFDYMEKLDVEYQKKMHTEYVSISLKLEELGLKEKPQRSSPKNQKKNKKKSQTRKRKSRKSRKY